MFPVNTTEQSPTLTSVQAAKAQLETTLLAAIRSFEEATGLHVRGVHSETLRRMGSKQRETVYVTAEVRL